MTRKQLKTIIIVITLVYTFAFAAGVIIYFTDNSDNKRNYAIFKDFIPFMIAIPVAYLGYCFQRRSSYLLALRPLWTNLIVSVNTAIQYTHKVETTQKEYGETLTLLSVSIDEVRGVYQNITKGTDGAGFYPFESLKSIHAIISDLGYGVLDKVKSGESRKHIKHNWKNLRETFLLEFDRPEPTVFDSPYISSGKKSNQENSV